MPDRPIASDDPYATLGLERGAALVEVKRAYRRLAKEYHPDSAGEAALPRFLAIHEAYEAIRTGRPTARSRGAAAAPAGPEPWRADPERARAARERASRRGPASAGAGPRATGGGGASAAGTGAGGRAAGSAGRAGEASGTSGTPGTAGRTGTSGRARGGRKHVRKATLGSTTYDEARDANDPTWSGASWYGPSSGEYWIVNPREYADPRKHGPEYQSRARRPLGRADDGGPLEAGDSTSEGDPGAPGASAPGAGAPVGAAASAGAPRARAQASPAGVRATPWTFDRERSRTASTGAGEPRAAADAGPAVGGREADDGAGARAWGAAWPADARSVRRPRGRGFLGGTPRDWIGGPADDPIRRLGIALVAWPPLGLAAAALIGDVTGCTLYAADCTGTEPLLPWLAQAVVLGLLLLLPPLARVLAGGSIGVLFALVPVTAFLVAVGASGAPQAGFALAFLLGAAWLAGAGWAAWRQLRPGAAGTPA